MRSLFFLTSVAITASSAPMAARTLQPYVIFDFAQAGAMLRQCSRATPPIGEQGWTPAARDITRFEQAMPAALRGSGALPALAAFPKGWGRQYVGMIRGGRKVIYGNFFPLYDKEFDSWRTQPVAVCDGGKAFFGAEFDPGSGRITHIAFNGYA